MINKHTIENHYKNIINVKNWKQIQINLLLQKFIGLSISDYRKVHLLANILSIGAHQGNELGENSKKRRPENAKSIRRRAKKRVPKNWLSSRFGKFIKFAYTCS